MYIVLGICITLGALFYPHIQNIFQENRVQGWAIITGVTMMVVGIFSGYLYRLRMRREEEIERMHSSFREKEKDRV